MNFKLLFEAITKFIIGLIIVILLIFIPAGTYKYFNGWLLISLLFIPMFIAGMIMFIYNPNLLKSRLNAKEKEIEQKQVVIFSGLIFAFGFIISGLNYRYKWIILPEKITIISSIIFIIFYILYAIVLKENEYLSRTIKVSDNQKVVDTGVYSVIRHPMYLVTIVLFLMIPLILGSIISFIIFLLYPFVIIKRINNEEKVLEKKLIEYKEYKKKVKYKLIPYIW